MAFVQSTNVLVVSLITVAVTALRESAVVGTPTHNNKNVVVGSHARDADQSQLPPLRMTVALYSEPGRAWERMAATAKQHPSVPMTAIISPNHDDNDAPFAGDDIEKFIAHNATWMNGLAALRAAGIRIQHYFHMRNLSCSAETNCGCDSSPCCIADGECVPKYRCCNSIGNISAIVNASLTYFPEDGFFADNGDFGNHPFASEMLALTQRGLPSGHTPRPVLMNPGGIKDEWPLASTNMTVSCEFTALENSVKLPSFAAKYPRDRFVAIVHSVTTATEMRAAVDAFVHAGWGDLSVVDNYNDGVPEYWEEEVAYIAALQLAKHS